MWHSPHKVFGSKDWRSALQSQSKRIARAGIYARHPAGLAQDYPGVVGRTNQPRQHNALDVGTHCLASEDGS